MKRLSEMRKHLQMFYSARNRMANAFKISIDWKIKDETH